MSLVESATEETTPRMNSEPSCYAQPKYGKFFKTKQCVFSTKPSTSQFPETNW